MAKRWSSPVIWGQQVWLTTATPDGHELFAVCVDRDTGKRPPRPEAVRCRQAAGPATPSIAMPRPHPAIEAGRLYVTFGAPGTACLDTQTGKVLWTRRDIECNHFRGAGSSPILYSNLLFLNFDGSDHQFVVALDKQTGRTVWQKKRSIDFQDLGPDGQPEQGGDYRKAFATCQIATFEGRTTLLSQGSKALYAYDPSSGAELWRVEERTSYSGATRPVTGHGLVFCPQRLCERPGAGDPARQARRGPRRQGSRAVRHAVAGGVEDQTQRAEEALPAAPGGFALRHRGQRRRHLLGGDDRHSGLE